MIVTASAVLWLVSCRCIVKRSQESTRSTTVVRGRHKSGPSAPPNPNPSRNSSGAMHTRHAAGAVAGDPSSGIEGLGGWDCGTNPDFFLKNHCFAKSPSCSQQAKSAETADSPLCPHDPKTHKDGSLHPLFPPVWLRSGPLPGPFAAGCAALAGVRRPGGGGRGWAGTSRNKTGVPSRP